MGAPQFGARKAASCSLDDIKGVADYAHAYGCRLHVALNTILRDSEVEEARHMAWQLYEAGADALIVQDTALMCGDMPPIELHASTQCDNRTAEKVLFWEKMGLAQVVLARELSISEIAEIAKQSNVRLEAFIHGALCVSFSGQCYMSYAIGGRSANRGECAQPCRMAYDVTAADGSSLCKRRHVLSLKDNNQTQNIEALIDVGVSSFKIEGRLKDAAYVSNVTMHYRQLLDQIIARKPELRRLSVGEVIPSFSPDVRKSFNRGFTDYFAHGRQNDIWQPLTPKSIGEPIGKATSCKGNEADIATSVKIANGDGLVYISTDGRTGGMRVNTATDKGKVQHVSCQSIAGLHVGDMIFRNLDTKFEALLKNDSTRRLVDIDICATIVGNDLTVSIKDIEGISSQTTTHIECEKARNAGAGEQALRNAMNKTGDTIFRLRDMSVADEVGELFIPQSVCNGIRRTALAEHLAKRIEAHRPLPYTRMVEGDVRFPAEGVLVQEANILNAEAKAFYESHGAEVSQMAFESKKKVPSGAVVMTTRHCILHSLGRCIKTNPKNASLLPLHITSDNNTFLIKTDCKACVMRVFKQ